MNNPYIDLLLTLLPDGEIWNKEVDSELYKLVYGLSQELYRLDLKLQELMVESNPVTMSRFLTARENEAGLPDLCIGIPDTIQARIQLVLYKWANLGGASKQFLIDACNHFGFVATIEEYNPFRAGHNRTGEELTTEKWSNVFKVNCPSTDPIIYFKAGVSFGGDYLWSKWDHAAVNCIIEKLKPAHTRAIYNFY